MTLSRRDVLAGAVGGLCVSAGLAPTAAAAVPPNSRWTLGTPIPYAHAHNDYAHARPLFDALARGFASVEADVWLIDGELRLGHTRLETRPGFTLTSAYLEPLAWLAQQNRHILPGVDRPLQLLIDLKTDGAETYSVIERELRRFPTVFTESKDGRVRPGAVTAVLSGGRPLDLIASQRQRFSFVDGRPGQEGQYPSTLMPLVSENWYSMFGWGGVFPMPAADRQRLETFTSRCHAGGHSVRFYGTPDVDVPARTRLWDQLRTSGVDWLNTDDLDGMLRYSQRTTSER